MSTRPQRPALSDVIRISISQIREKLLFICLRREPRTNPFDLGIIRFAKPGDVDLLETPTAIFFLRLGLPERSEHRVEIVVQIAFLERIPLVAIQPDAFATITLIDGEAEAVPNQILHQAKATFGTIDCDARLSKREAAVA